MKIEKNILNKLAKNEDSLVRQGVAWNPNAPIEILEELSKDQSKHVRTGVAWNANTPIKILEELSKYDNDERVKKTATSTLKEKLKNQELKK